MAGSQNYPLQHGSSNNNIVVTGIYCQKLSCVASSSHHAESESLKPPIFWDWAGDCTLHQRETIEAALAHSIKDRAEAAYRRSTAIEKRRIHARLGRLLWEQSDPT